MSNSEEILFNEYISFNERFTEFKIQTIVNNNIVKPVHKPLFSGEMYDSYKDKIIVTNPFNDDFKQSKPLYNNPFNAY